VGKRKAGECRSFAIPMTVGAFEGAIQKVREEIDHLPPPENPGNLDNGTFRLYEKRRLLVDSEFHGWAKRQT